jgi:PhnB protein
MPNVKPVPQGYHTVTPSITCKGAAEAIEFYKKAFGAKESHRMPGPDGKIMHAEIMIGDSPIMMNDEFPEMNCKSPLSMGGSPVTIHIYVDNVDAFWDKAVKAGCTVRMPLSDMFWGDRYGKVSDPFGHQWSIGQHVEDVSPQDMMKRGEEAMKQMAASRK